MRYAYPFTLTPDEDGRIVVGFPDVQGASTDGADEDGGGRQRIRLPDRSFDRLTLRGTA